jgi:hypothetical protein
MGGKRVVVFRGRTNCYQQPQRCSWADNGRSQYSLISEALTLSVDVAPLDEMPAPPLSVDIELAMDMVTGRDVATPLSLVPELTRGLPQLDVPTPRLVDGWNRKKVA